VAAEAYAFGQWILQFKRYLPGIIKGFFRSEMKDDSLGRWTKTEKFEPQFDEDGNLVQNDDMNVYEWTEAVHEGRHRLVFNMLRGTLGKMGGWNKEKDENDLNPSSLKGFDYTNYKWSEVMKNPRKQQDLIWYISTAMGMATALALYGAMVPDDEENTYWAWRFNRLIMDVSQGLNPMDILDPIRKEPVVVISVGGKVIGATLQYLWGVGENVIEPGSGRLQNGNMPGVKTLRKHVPILNGYMQFSTVMEDVGYWEKTPERR